MGQVWGGWSEGTKSYMLIRAGLEYCYNYRVCCGGVNECRVDPGDNRGGGAICHTPRK